MRKYISLAGVLIACLVAGVVIVAAAFAGQAKVTLCHLADGPAQAGLITVAAPAAYNGHYLQHSADIIPPFEFQGETYSLNWAGSFPEECVGTETTPGTTTDEPPVTTTDDCTPGVDCGPCDEDLAANYECEQPPPVIDPDPPVVHGCKKGYSPYKGECVKNDSAIQPNGSELFGEQG